MKFNMFPYFRNFIIIVSVFVLVSCEGMNVTRQPRIFTFNADAEDVEVGFDFSIPFLKIPLKKTFNAVAQFGLPGISLSKINLNPMAVVLAGLIIFSTSIFAPLLNTATAWHHLGRSSRTTLENETDEATLYITEKLLAHSRGCPERIACWLSQRNKNPEDMETMKQIMSNKLLATMLNTTTLEIATTKGRSGQKCELYTPCPIDKKSLPKIIRSFSILTSLKLHY